MGFGVFSESSCSPNLETLGLADGRLLVTVWYSKEHLRPQQAQSSPSNSVN